MAQMKFSHQLVSIVLFAVLVGLIVSAYSGFKEGYGAPEEFTVEGNTVLADLEQLNLLANMNETAVRLQSLSTPASNFFDLLGGLAGAAIGALKVVVSLFTLPFEILTVINTHYPIPGMVLTGISLTIILYIGFQLVSMYLNKET